MNVINS